MTPKDAREHLSAYLDGELDEATRRELEAALGADPELRAALDALGRTADLVRSFERCAAPEGFGDRVAAAIARPAAPAWRRWTPAIVAAAACLVVAFLTVMGTTPGPRPQSKSPETAREQDRTGAPLPEAEAVRKEALRDDRAEKRDKFADADAKNGARGARLREKVAPLGGPEPAAPPAPRPLKPTMAAPAGLRVAKDAHRRSEKAVPATRSLYKKKSAFAVSPAPGAAAEVRATDAVVAAQHQEMDAEEELKALVRRIEHTRATARVLRAPARSKAAVAKLKAEATKRRVAIVEYTDLRRALAEVTEALRQAGVAYALQPQGQGRFVVETMVTEEQAAALLVALRRPKARRHAGRAAATMHREVAEGKAKIVGAKEQPAPRIHLVIRFRRAPAAQR